MLKKVATLVGVLALLLATAQLAMAQQNTDQTQSLKTTFEATGGTQSTGDTQTTGGGQTTSSDPARQEDQGGAGDQGAATTPAPNNVWTVSIGDFFFDPADAAVGSGDAIVFVNEGAEAHTVTSDDGQFDSGRLEPGESVTVSFEGAGTLTYHCQIHPEMVGSVTVG